MQTFATLDLDSGGGVVTNIAVGLAIPGPGGPVPGGTFNAPIMIDPTNATYTKVIGPTENDEPGIENPVLIGLRASANEPTAVDTDGDAVYPWADMYGRQVTVSGHPSRTANATHGPTSGTKATNGDTDAVATPGVGQSLHVTSLLVSNSNATGNQVQFKDGAGGTLGLNAWVTNSAPVFVTFDPPWKLTANTALVINCSAALANTIWSAHFYTTP